MNHLKILKRAWQAIPFSDHTRWKVLSLLLEPLMPLIKGGVVATAYLREKEWQQRRIRPFYGDPFPNLPKQTKPDLFIWSVIDWRFRIQRPQHIATGLAKLGYRVFYISNAFVNARRPGFELEPMHESLPLFSVRLHLPGRPAVYAAPPSEQESKRLRSCLATLFAWTETQGCTSIVQHPYWYEAAKALPNSRLVYDCMDFHEGFANTGTGIGKLELTLLKQADAVVTTSQQLTESAGAHNGNVTLIRNAADYAFFSVKPDEIFLDTHGRKVIGYYGAIAEWLDLDLVEKVARQFADCLVLLVGADECGAYRRLSPLPNVLMTGEVKYRDLPFYLYGMDVCLLPFLVTPLTLATNPVKVYEYLSAAKPVVSVDLPELAQFAGLVATAGTHERFLEQVKLALAHPQRQSLPAERKRFASHNSWPLRIESFAKALESISRPLISIIVVTFNNLALTRACLESLQSDSTFPWTELIVVDNASDDGTPEFLLGWSEQAPRRQVVLNRENRGFSAANNQGLACANGDYLVLLNNDTEVTAGWAHTLMNHLRRDPTIGLIGPVTNNIGNEAKIQISYRNPSEMHAKARNYTLQHMGELLPIRTLAFYCVMMSRQVYEQVGPLDEAFGLGFFEDDDYCRRVEQEGWRIVCAEDVFVHHHLSASFKALDGRRAELMARNRKIYEAKWGPWVPHKYR